MQGGIERSAWKARGQIVEENAEPQRARDESENVPSVGMNPRRNSYTYRFNDRVEKRKRVVGCRRHEGQYMRVQKDFWFSALC